MKMTDLPAHRMLWMSCAPSLAREWIVREGWQVLHFEAEERYKDDC